MSSAGHLLWDPIIPSNQGQSLSLAPGYIWCSVLLPFKHLVLKSLLGALCPVGKIAIPMPERHQFTLMGSSSCGHIDPSVSVPNRSASDLPSPQQLSALRTSAMCRVENLGTKLTWAASTLPDREHSFPHTSSWGGATGGRCVKGPAGL